jgi:hypothetical protein|eukprot:COSAG01_NODE_5622_length_4141_cov_15.405740_2_plen_52_part_00
MRYCASVVVTAAQLGVSCGCSERVTLWSVHVWVAYVLCVLLCCCGGHDGHI